MSIQPKSRFESIDMLRGLAMVIMALDHVREYFHVAANLNDPLNLEATTPVLFFTRWITHFCAPVFVFLSGTSIYLQCLKKTKKEVSAFLIKRGFWLILVEVLVISLAWSFNPGYNLIFLQVIWAIAISMIILGLIIRLPFNLILITGLLIVFGHNLFDQMEAVPGFKAGFLWDLLHSARFTAYEYLPKYSVMIVYPFLPYTGLMMIGFCAGVWFTPAYSPENRKNLLISTGLALIAFFIIFRFLNIYGDPVMWSVQKKNILTFLSFINVNKYPPSLLYMTITIGPALILLAYLESFKNKVTDILRTYGRVAFFYYIVHLYLVHLLSAMAFFSRGHSITDAAKTGEIYPFYFVATGEGYSLGIVCLVWIAVVAILYPLCKWYDNYKINNREKWWLSYV